jgi:acyl-CoA synthetase (NDP forming)
VLSEFESKRLLAAAGLPVTREELVHTADEAVSAARRIGFPVALKVQSPDLTHKSDVGALALGLTGEDNVRRTYQRLVADVCSRRPDARIDGALVQEMVSDGVEVLLGMKRDPCFGPAVVVSPGGVLVELFDDAAQLGFPPLCADLAEDMLRRSRALATLLGGFRGRPAADRAALVQLITDFAHFVEELSDDVVAVDLNPVIVRPRGRGVTIIDAAIERTSPSTLK